jgi:prefoldin subunit 5
MSTEHDILVERLHREVRALQAEVHDLRAALEQILGADLERRTNEDIGSFLKRLQNASRVMLHDED